MGFHASPVANLVPPRHIDSDGLHVTAYLPGIIKPESFSFRAPGTPAIMVEILYSRSPQEWIFHFHAADSLTAYEGRDYVDAALRQADISCAHAYVSKFTDACGAIAPALTIPQTDAERGVRAMKALPELQAQAAKDDSAALHMQQHAQRTLDAVLSSLRFLRQSSAPQSGASSVLKSWISALQLQTH